MSLQSRPAKVTFVTKSLVPPRGMERALLRTAAALTTRYDVEVVVLDGPGEVVPPGVRTTSLGAGSTLGGLRALRPRLRARRPDEVLVLTGLWTAARALLASPSALRGAVAWEHSLTRGRIRSGPRFRLKAEVAARAYRRCARVVVVSDPVGEALAQEWSITSVTVPNLLGLDPESPGSRLREAPAADGVPARLVAVGAAKPVKNYDLLLRALARVDVPWRLQMLGGGPMQEELQGLASSLGVADRVEWLGDVPDVSQHLLGADLLVHPAASETFGYVLIEAAEHWLPVVAVDAPVMDRLVPDLVPGVLCQPDEGSFAAAVADALGRRGTWDHAAADARRRATFDDERTLRAWADVLDAVGGGDAR